MKIEGLFVTLFIEHHMGNICLGISDYSQVR